jgi:hypothetical protein
MAKGGKRRDVTKAWTGPIANEGEVAVAPDIAGGEVDPAAATASRSVQYTFERNPECPRCHARDTVAVKTAGCIQYRKCRRAICRQDFKVGAIHQT